MDRRSIDRVLPPLLMLVIALAMSLEGAYATLQVKRAPTVSVQDWNTNTPIADASVYLDDVLAGTTDSSGQRVIRTLSAGSHHLRVSKEGYTDYETVVNTNDNGGFTARARITSMASPSSNLTYTMFIDTADANRTKARNSFTGKINYAGTDAAAVLQSVIDGLARTGGLIVLAPGTYIWQSVPAFPKDLPSWLKIVGENGATILLTSSGPRAFDFKKTADYDTFRNVWIENILIDANNVGGKGHVVLGTYQGAGTESRINIEGIVLRSITTTNVLVDPTMTHHRLNIYLAVSQASPNEKQDYIKSVWIENCHLRGGNMGVVVGGAQSSAGPNFPGLNIFVDNIHVENCWHSLLSVQNRMFYSSNFHIGARGFGGYAHITGCYGEYSGDVGVEVNAMDVLVENTRIRDANNAAFFHTNYNNPQSGAEQSITFKNCEADKLSLNPLIAVSQVGSAFYALSRLSVPLGRLTFSNCIFNSSVLPSFQEYGEALEIVTSSGMTALTVDGLTSIMQGIVFGGHNHLYVVYINVAGSTPLVTLKNLDLAVQDSRETGYLELTGIDLEGNMLLNLDSAALNVDIANMTRWGTKGIDLGGQSANINGTISRFRIVQIVTDPSPRGIVVHGTATLTIPTMLTIRECDFTAMTGGTAILFDSGNQNKDKVYLYNNRP